LAIYIAHTFSNKCLDQPGVRSSELVRVQTTVELLLSVVSSQAMFCSAAVQSGVDGQPVRRVAIDLACGRESHSS
jgi:hypothetical protein